MNTTYTPDDSNNEFTTDKSYYHESTSYKALHHALSSLYRMDDFHKEFIGLGFYSRIYKVTHKQNGKVLVLKLNTREENRMNMLNEVQLMNRLQHDNILRYMGACVHQGQLHALTEYIRGGSLEVLLADKSQTLDWKTRITLTKDIALGMSYLHHKLIMHRDLTSKNVLIDFRLNGDMKAVICDFGLAIKIPDELSRHKLATVGSPWWMSPECIHGEVYNEKADVFSIGIIMCEITSRMQADPDYLPRTQNFGLDYIAFSHMVHECPLAYLKLAFTCCQINATKRPSFETIYKKLTCLTENSEMQNIIDEHPNKSVISDRTTPTALYVGKGLKRNHSDDHLPVLYRSNDIFSDISLVTLMTPKNLDDEMMELSILENLTPKIIGEEMSKNDEFYLPSSNNPFTSRFSDQGANKILENSITIKSSPLSPKRRHILRSNSLPLCLTAGNGAGCSIASTADSDYSEESNLFTELTCSVYSSDSCFDESMETGPQDLALVCSSRKQKFQEIMRNWKSFATTADCYDGAGGAGSKQRRSRTESIDMKLKSWARVQEVRNFWEERLLNLAANEAKQRDDDIL